MDSGSKETTIHRLRSVAGHVKSVERMVTDDKYCIDVIKQIKAVQAALTSVSYMVMSRHLDSCVMTAIRGKDPSERERVLKEIMEVYQFSSK